MTYVVNNNAVYFNALSGAFAGMGASGKVPTDDNPADYATLVAVGTAFAQSLDQLIPPTTGIPSIFEGLISGLCTSVWENRTPQGTAEDLDPATYTPICKALIAMIYAYGSSPVTPQVFAAAPTLYYFDVLGGPVVPPSSIGEFNIQTDSFNFADVGECAWWATVPDQTGPGSVQSIVSVKLAPGSNPGATCAIVMYPQNIDDVIAATTGPFRLVLALYPIPANPATVVPP